MVQAIADDLMDCSARAVLNESLQLYQLMIMTVIMSYRRQTALRLSVCEKSSLRADASNRYFALISALESPCLLS